MLLQPDAYSRSGEARFDDGRSRSGITVALSVALAWNFDDVPDSLPEWNPRRLTREASSDDRCCARREMIECLPCCNHA